MTLERKPVAVELLYILFKFLSNTFYLSIICKNYNINPSKIELEFSRHTNRWISYKIL